MSNNNQILLLLSIVSTVAIKFAKAPDCISTKSPLCSAFGGSSLPKLSQRDIRPVTTAEGTIFGAPFWHINRETPNVLFILCHGAPSSSMLTNIYPGKSGFVLVKNSDPRFLVNSCNGKNVLNPCRFRLRSAMRWEFLLN